MYWVNNQYSGLMQSIHGKLSGKRVKRRMWHKKNSERKILQGTELCAGERSCLIPAVLTGVSAHVVGSSALPRVRCSLAISLLSEAKS